MARTLVDLPETPVARLDDAPEAWAVEAMERAAAELGIGIGNVDVDGEVRVAGVAGAYAQGDGNEDAPQGAMDASRRAWAAKRTSYLPCSRG